MSDFFSLYNERYDRKYTPITTEYILNELCTQLNKEWNSFGIVALLLTTSGDMVSYFTHSVQLNVQIANSYYTYRYIEARQPLESEFDVDVFAFQNPPRSFGKAEDGATLREILTQIVGDIRTRVVVEHLKQIASNYASKEDTSY